LIAKLQYLEQSYKFQRSFDVDDRRG